jgi:hypothetical protein
MKGEAMRILTLVAVLSVIAGSSATAQAPTDERPAQQMPPPVPEQSVTAINLVRFEDLPPQLKTVVETKLRDTNADELHELQASVQTSPTAMTMLAQHGLNASQVVAAAVDPTGVLTLVIQDTA